MTDRDTGSQNIESLGVQNPGDWTSKIAQVLGTEPTYTINSDDNPGSYETTAVFHVRRADVDPDLVLDDSTAIGITIIRDNESGSEFRVDVRAQNVGGRSGGVYDNGIDLVLLDRETQSVQLINTRISEDPFISVSANGTTTPSLDSLLGLNQQ